jgi:hypothetical protein
VQLPEPGRARLRAPRRYTRRVPGLYLLAILLSFVGAALIDRRLRLGLWSRATAAAILVVEVAFLVFDAVGAAGGWFASNPTWVIAVVPPGIPPEEPLLLAFITVWALLLYRVTGRVTGEEPA